MGREIKRVALDFKHEGIWPGYIRPNGLSEEEEQWEMQHPPEGPGYQIWETVSEGSPSSPVFATEDELVEHLHEHGAGGIFEPCSRAAAREFVKAKWVCSGVGTSRGMTDGINAYSLMSSKILRDFATIEDTTIDLLLTLGCVDSSIGNAEDWKGEDNEQS